MQNPYKRLDVFRCKLDSHESFSGRVSPYHVLKVKRCLDEGCFYFKWRCRLLEKGASCRKGYKHPGKNCLGCRYYFEDKLHKVPEVRLTEAAYRSFLRELEDFEDWLADYLGRRLTVYGRVNHVGPLLVKTLYPKNSRVALKGYLANFAECYLDRTHLEDFVYLRLSASLQRRLGLVRGDLVEFTAELALDEGRLVLENPGRFEFEQRESSRFAAAPLAGLVEARLARVLCEQSERCIRCERGRLVDVLEKEIGGFRFLRRELYCLEGVRDPASCCWKALAEIGLRDRPGEDGDEQELRELILSYRKTYG